MEDLKIRTEGQVDEAFIRRAVDGANLNALRLALYQSTGEDYLSELPLADAPFWGGAFFAKIVALDRWAEFKDWAVKRLSAGPLPQTDLPSPAEAKRLMEMFGGRPLSDFEGRHGLRELAFDAAPVSVEWGGPAPSPETVAQHRVLVVGAGFSGVMAGIHLNRLGIPYDIIDREEGMGGTWWINTYPDARVDVPSHSYQFSFEKYPWKHWYAPQTELRDYIAHVARKHDVERNVIFGAELLSADWDEASGLWTAKVRKGGEIVEMRANAIIGGTGVFGRPAPVKIEGLDSFAGSVFHTADWNHDVDYRGKRVAIIGTGSSGCQLMPRIAGEVEQVTVFQRTAPWISPITDYRGAVSAEAQWLFDNVPNYWNWYCYAGYWTLSSDIAGLHDFDDEWQAAGGLVSQRNDIFRDYLLDFMRTKLADRPELIEKCTPNYPPWSKRPVVDNGYYDALLRDNVELVTEGISHITPTGVVTRDGAEHPFDIIVLATGFVLEPWGAPAEFKGRDGQRLSDFWGKDGSRAYLSMTVPGFPNFFMLHGPNSLARTGGTVRRIEDWSRFSVNCIAHMIAKGAKAFEVRDDVFRDYNAEMDRRLEKTVWNFDGNNSYYKNHHGRVAVMQPWMPEEVFKLITHPKFDEYRVE